MFNRFWDLASQVLPFNWASSMSPTGAVGAVLLCSLWMVSSARADEGQAPATERTPDRPLDSSSVGVGAAADRFGPVQVAARLEGGRRLMIAGAIYAVAGYLVGVSAVGLHAGSEYLRGRESRLWWLVPLIGAPLSLLGTPNQEEIATAFWLLFLSTAPQIIGLGMILVGLVQGSAKAGSPRRTGVQPLLGPGGVGLAVPFG